MYSKDRHFHRKNILWDGIGQDRMEDVMKQTLQGGMLGGSFSLVRTRLLERLTSQWHLSSNHGKMPAALDWHWGATVLLGGYEPWLDPNGDWLPSQFLLLQPTSLSWLLLYIADPKRTAGSTSLLPVRFAIGPATHRCEVWGGNHPWRLRGSLSQQDALSEFQCQTAWVLAVSVVLSHVSFFFQNHEIQLITIYNQLASTNINQHQPTSTNINQHQPTNPPPNQPTSQPTNISQLTMGIWMDLVNLSASGIWISCPVECGRCHGGIPDEASDLGTVTEGLGFAPLGPCVSFREGEWDGDGSNYWDMFFTFYWDNDGKSIPTHGKMMMH